MRDEIAALLAELRRLEREAEAFARAIAAEGERERERELHRRLERAAQVGGDAWRRN